MDDVLMAIFTDASTPVSTGMGDRLRASISPWYRYATGHSGQLSLAIPSWIGAVSTLAKAGR